MAFVRVARFLLSFSWFTSNGGVGDGSRDDAAPICDRCECDEPRRLWFRRTGAGRRPKDLRLIMRNDLRVLDPMWTTAYATRNHAYMVFRHAVRARFQIPAAPADGRDYSISPDKLVYSFTLRDELNFHDGQPVRGPTASPR